MLGTFLNNRKPFQINQSNFPFCQAHTGKKSQRRTKLMPFQQCCSPTAAAALRDPPYWHPKWRSPSSSLTSTSAQWALETQLRGCQRKIHNQQGLTKQTLCRERKAHRTASTCEALMGDKGCKCMSENALWVHFLVFLGIFLFQWWLWKTKLEKSVKWAIHPYIFQTCCIQIRFKRVPNPVQLLKGLGRANTCQRGTLVKTNKHKTQNYLKLWRE